MNKNTKTTEQKHVKHTKASLKAVLRELLDELAVESPMEAKRTLRATKKAVKTKKPAPKARAFASLYGSDVPGLEGLTRSKWESTFRKVAAALDVEDTGKATALMVALPLAARDTDEWGACADGVYALSGDVVDFYDFNGRR